MLDTHLLADPDPRVAALLAVCPILDDYSHEYGRATVRGLIPDVSDIHADQLISEVTEALRTAEELWEQAARVNHGEALRDEWIGHAADAARHAILRTENRTVAA